MASSQRQYRTSQAAHTLLPFVPACVCMWMIAVSAANGEAIRTRFPLTPSQVISAMQSLQLPTTGVQVQLSTPITAATTDPTLEIQAVSVLDAHEVRLRVGCRERSECLSFFAVAKYEAVVDPSALKLTGHPATKPKQSSPSGKISLIAQEDPAPVSSSRSSDGPVMRNGSPATLNFDDGRVHIRLEVVCLESGAAGDTIHVASHDHKQTYTAKIVSPTLVKGIF